MCCRSTQYGRCWQPRPGTLLSDMWLMLHVEQLCVGACIRNPVYRIIAADSPAAWVLGPVTDTAVTSGALSDSHCCTGHGTACQPLRLLLIESAWDAGECERVSAELAESEKAGAELMQERDELSSRGSALEAELEGARQALPRMSCSAAACSG